MNDVACLIVDWKREENLPAVLEGVRAQTLDMDIFVVHQENSRHCEGCINISHQGNIGSGMKFAVLSMIPNEYTAIIDNDLKLTDDLFMETLFLHCETHGFVGAVGVHLGPDPDKPYTSGSKIYAPIEPTPVDIVLTNACMLHTFEATKRWNSNLDLIRSIQCRKDERPEMLLNEDVIYSLVSIIEGRQPVAVGNGAIPYQVLDTADGLEHTELHYRSRDANASQLR